MSEIKSLSKQQQDRLIRSLTAELAALRAKAEISQGELSSLIGISRQTYSALENGAKSMSWSTYLSLILFYDYNSKTHRMIRSMGVFPEELISVINDGGGNPYDTRALLPGIPEEISRKLDEQAYQAIRTVIMLEYARCENLPGDTVVKSFNGITFGKIDANEKASSALKAIKESRKKQ